MPQSALVPMSERPARTPWWRANRLWTVDHV